MIWNKSIIFKNANYVRLGFASESYKDHVQTKNNS